MLALSPKIKGILFTFISAASISVTFIASKQALLELHTLGFNAIWFTAASVWGLAYYFVQADKVSGQFIRAKAGILILLGLLSCGANYFFFSSVQLGDPTVVAFFSRSETIFSLLWGVFLLHEQLTRRQWIGAAITIIGAAVMTYQGGRIILLVLAMTLVGNFFNATTSLIAKQNVATVPPVILGIARTLVLAVVFNLLAGLSGHLTMPGLRVWLWILGGSFFGPFLSFIFYYQALKTVDMSQATIIRSTQPLFVALYSLILFGSSISGLQFGGGLIILLGVTLMLSGGVNKHLSSMGNPRLFFRRTKNNSSA